MESSLKYISNISSALPKTTFVALFCFLILWPSINGQLRSPLYLLERESLVVRTADGVSAQFEVVSVTTRADQAQGLMYVRHLPLDQGMVFSYSRNQVLSMWMKNTYIPLDMWFVDAGGQVQKVVSHTLPHSLESIKSDSPVRAVVEVNAGLSALLGVTAGAIVDHRAFQQDQ